MARRAGMQVAPEQYFGVAMEILAREGASGLKIAPLCRALDLTSGSFYYHFDGWAGFVRGLLAYWEAEQTARVLNLARAAGDPEHRVDLMKNLALAVPHAAEAAIRAWGALDADVGEAQRRIDKERIAALQEIVAGVVVDGPTAHRLAVLGMSILVGFQQMITPPDVTLLGELLDEYQAVILRHRPGG